MQTDFSWPSSPQVWTIIIQNGEQSWCVCRSALHHHFRKSDTICWQKLWTARKDPRSSYPPASRPTDTLCWPGQLRVAEKSGCAGTLSPEILSRVPCLHDSPAGSRRQRAAVWPRPAVSGYRSQQQPVCWISGCVQDGTGEGIRPDSDGGDRAICQIQRVQAPVPVHAW